MSAPRFTVLCAEFQNEVNTFSVVPTTYRHYAEDVLLFGDEALAVRRDANTELAGFRDVALRHGWKLVHVVSAIAEPAGRVTRDAYERIAGCIVAAARAHAGAIDGVLLGLHGAMVTECHEDGEGELLRRLRAELGMAVPIAVTLDPHANVTRAMCDLAEILVSYRTYPHVDMRDTARRAAALLHRSMLGEIRPLTLCVARPMLEEANGGRTDTGPMLARLARAAAYEQQADVFAVSINSGFPNADVAEAGPTVLVTAQGDMERHAAFAAELADDMWRQRGEVLAQLLEPQHAVEHCQRLLREDAARRGPVVLADYADNPGGGAYGDATDLLRAMLAARLPNACFGPIIDPATVDGVWDCRPGDRVQVALGGKIDPALGGAPILTPATVLTLSEGHWTGSGPMMQGITYSWGRTAVLDIDGIEVLVTSRSMQILDLEQFRAFGIEPACKDVVGLKSMQHFRAVFDPIASHILLCDSGALCTRDMAALPFRRRARPVYPLDPGLDLDSWLQRNGQGLHVPAPDVRRAIDRYCDSLVGADLPALGVSVVHQGKTVHCAGYGIASLEQGTPAHEGTRHPMASTAKMLTAALVLLLERAGKLALDDSLAQYFPGSAPGWSAISLRHLLGMTSGLADYAYGYRADPARAAGEVNLWQDYTDAQLLALIASVPPNAAPGVAYRYCNAGYQLLGMIAGQVDGSGYQEALRRHVLAPLGMHETVPFRASDIVRDRAGAYVRAGAGLANAAWAASSLTVTGDGGLLSSARDIARWLTELDRPQVLDAALLEQMLRPALLDDGRPAVSGYAMGWRQSALRGQRKLRHGGTWDGARAEIIHFPERRLSIAVFANMEDADPAVIAQAIAGLLDPGLAPYAPVHDAAPELTQRDRALLQRFVGGALAGADCTGAVLAAWDRRRVDEVVGERRQALLEVLPLLTEAVQEGESQVRRYVWRMGAHQVHWKVSRQQDGRVDAMVFTFE